MKPPRPIPLPPPSIRPKRRVRTRLPTARPPGLNIRSPSRGPLSCPLAKQSKRIPAARNETIENVVSAAEAVSAETAKGEAAKTEAGKIEAGKTEAGRTAPARPERPPAREQKPLTRTIVEPLFNTKEGSAGWQAPFLAQWLATANEKASQLFFGKPAAYMGEGGSIPFMGMLGRMYPEAQFLITGVLGPNSNAHGPNEFLHLDMAKKLTGCISMVLALHYTNC